MQEIAGVLIAVIMGLYFNWKLGLVCSLFFPLLIIAVVCEQRIIQGVDSVEKVQGVSKNWAHFVFVNFSTSTALRNKIKGIARKLSPSTFRKCTKTYRSAKRCLRNSRMNYKSQF
jgi:hypothetical protein